MSREPYSSISILLDTQDIRYLSNLLYTIETDPNLRERLIPQQQHPSKNSNFVRVEHKLHALLQWYGLSSKFIAIKKPQNPLKQSRLKPHHPPTTPSKKFKKGAMDSKSE